MSRMTEDELNSILAKGKISLNSTTKISNNKISLTNDKENIKKKNSNINVYEIIKSNKESIINTTISDTHFSMTFEGAKLLSINQIFAILQYRKYEMFNYKKSWHDIIKNVLDVNQLYLKKQGQKLPFFEEAVELTVLRQAPRLVDEDALAVMFKYIIDALKRDKDKNPNGILAEDNPKIVHKIESYSEKGSHALGIKVKLIENNKKEPYTLDKILIK